MRVTFIVVISIISVSLSADTEYTIGPGDVIQISVWQYDQFNGTIPVGPDGKITLHLLGDITVAGLTREGVKNEITKRLSGFIKEGAEVTVNIVQFNSQKIYIFGQVRNPRTITFSSIPSLVEVLVGAVPTPEADLTAVKIIPADTSIRKPIIVNMEEVLQKGDTSQLPKLRSGDTVYVPKVEIKAIEATSTEPQRAVESAPTEASAGAAQFIIHVMGAVARPGSFVSNQEPTLTQALLQAGDVTDSAVIKDIRVIAKGGVEGSRVEEFKGSRIIHVDLDKYLKAGDPSLIPRLQSGDIIYVPTMTQEMMKELSLSISITGEVLRPGSYSSSEPLDILDAISLAGGLTRNADPERIRIRKESADSYQEKIVNMDEFLRDDSFRFSESPPEMVEPGYRIYVPAKRGSATTVAIAARGVITFLADLIPIYGVWRMLTVR